MEKGRGWETERHTIIEKHLRHWLSSIFDRLKCQKINPDQKGQGEAVKLKMLGEY